MIDFRYHIVSLIAVFLALAVGVVLGAGPLRGSLGDQLTGQVETLRAEKEALRVELDDAHDDIEGLETYVDSAAEQLLPGTLTDVGVTVVELPGADGDVVAALLDRVGQAGGRLTGHVVATSRWTDPAEQASRDQVAAEVAGTMLVPPSADASTEQVLGRALGQALTERDPLSSEGFSADAGAMYASLLDAGLIEETEPASEPADVLLVIAPAPLDDPDQATDADTAVLEIGVATVTGMAGRDAVLAGTDTGSTDLVDAVRSDPAAAEAVSTVDSADDVTGQVSAPLALAAVQRGAGVGHYGLADNASAVIPVPPALPDSTDTSTDDATEGDT